LPVKEGKLYNLQTMDEPELNANIQGLRAQLDEVDREIVRTLNQRALLVQELAAVKGEAGVALYDPKREEEILQRVAEENAGPIYDATMREIFAGRLPRLLFGPTLVALPSDDENASRNDEEQQEKIPRLQGDQGRARQDSNLRPSDS
jgi:chorismate mutase